MNQLIFKTIIVCLCIIQSLNAAEYEFHGIVDFRASSVDSLAKGYVAGGQGKFGLSDGVQFSIAQAGAQIAVTWDNGLSAHGVINAFIDDEDSTFGLTEAYFKYKGLPNESGYRFQIKAGIFYPEISLENNAYAWASKDTLNSSMINTWIGEEIRVLGSEFKLTRLGRMNNDAFDLSLSASVFTNNDPAGALIAWHGWTTSSRQTLWTESRQFPWFPALESGFALAGQAEKSDPFLELDNNVGIHIRGEWSLRGKGELSFGYYDNNATPYEAVNGQYGWHTRFYHIGSYWKLVKGLTLTAQYLNGDTLMQNKERLDIVNNTYNSAFVALTLKWGGRFIGSKDSKHKTTIRIENFNVTDRDNTWGDNNNEDGEAITLSHSYRLNKYWFLSAEFIHVDSERPARYYAHQPINLVEKQLQIAARYFF